MSFICDFSRNLECPGQYRLTSATKGKIVLAAYETRGQAQTPVLCVGVASSIDINSFYEARVIVGRRGCAVTHIA